MIIDYLFFSSLLKESTVSSSSRRRGLGLGLGFRGYGGVECRRGTSSDASSNASCVASSDTPSIAPSCPTIICGRGQQYGIRFASKHQRQKGQALEVFRRPRSFSMRTSRLIYEGKVGLSVSAQFVLSCLYFLAHLFPSVCMSICIAFVQHCILDFMGA